ncbi:polyamine-modulated factor 1-like [Porites lutea]|uniref:polyamine-modulated factor 1-like n=1 Tax=Porites lutea TaxID=51062 RepID=UPI003CC65926
MEGKMAEGSSSLKECSSLEKQEESEGRRMESFRKVMRKCLDKIMATGSQEKFSSCFTSIREKNPVEFRSITEQLMQHLQNNIEKEIELMIKQEDLVYFFNELDRIIEATGKGDKQPAWRPSGNPDKDICDHIMQVKLAYKEQLTHILHELESNNEKLNGEVLPKREKLIETEKQLNEKTKDLREAAKYCKENSVQELHDQCVMLSQK